MKVMPPRRDHRRSGLLMPSSTARESEFVRILPEGLARHAARLPPGTRKPDGNIRPVRDVDPASRKAADDDVGAIAAATTVLCFPGDIRNEYESIERTEAASGRPAVTAARANTQPRAAWKVQRGGRLGPCGDRLNAAIAILIEASGFPVAARRATDDVADLEIDVFPEQIACEPGLAADRPEARTAAVGAMAASQLPGSSPGWGRRSTNRF
jgi:maleate cis-trans isomerase